MDETNSSYSRDSSARPATGAGYRLLTLGRLALVAPDGAPDPTLATRRRKLVLLVVLASSTRPLSRDTLLSWFWPEQDEPRARHSLSDALSHIRRVLGPASLSTRRAEVAFTPAARVTIDSAEFAAAMDGDAPNHERAVELYGGPFLDGVHVAASQTLEDWVARERTRLETLFARACEMRSAMLTRSNRWDECASLAARWLDASPLSTDAALLRLNAINAPGTRDAAQRAVTEYRRLSARLKEDYGRGPDRSVTDLARSIHSGLGTEASDDSLLDDPAPGPTSIVSISDPTSESNATALPPPAEVTRPWRPSRRTVAIVGGFAAAVVVAGVLRELARRPGATPGVVNQAEGSIEQAAFTPTSETDDDRVVLADFHNHTRDTILAGAVTEALRVDLEQSRVVRVLSTTQVQDALRRMRRAPNAALADSLARDVAVRGGAKAFITGDIGELGTAFTVSVQLISADNGNVLAAFREAARDSTALIGAVDRVSQQVRSRMGEALRSVRTSPPLEQVTTGSLAALRAYSQAIRAGETEGDGARAILLLQQAVSLDTGFAMAYRKLGIAWGNFVGGDREQREIAAVSKAFEYRDRLPDRERYLAMATYYQDTDKPDRAIAAYRALLEIEPRNTRALNNVSYIYTQLKDFRRAEQFARRATDSDTLIALPIDNLSHDQFNLGDYAGATRTSGIAQARFPKDTRVQWTAVALSAAQNDFVGAERRARQMLGESGNDYQRRTAALRLLAGIALVRGRLHDAEDNARQALDVARQQREAGDYLERCAFLAFIETWYRNAPERAVRTMSDAMQRYPASAIAPLERHADWVAYNFALAGRPDRARDVLAQFEASHPVLNSWVRGGYLRAEGAAWLAARQFDSAQAVLHRSVDQSNCVLCALPDLARAYDLGGNRDSAIAIYARYVSTPWSEWLDSDGEFHARTYRRLGELYEANADSVRAIAAYRAMVTLWHDADAELQPEVVVARRRLSALEQAGRQAPVRKGS